MQSQRNYGSFLSKSDLHVMIKNTMLARNVPKGKVPILTMAMQMAGGGGGSSIVHGYQDIFQLYGSVGPLECIFMALLTLSNEGAPAHFFHLM